MAAKSLAKYFVNYSRHNGEFLFYTYENQERIRCCRFNNLYGRFIQSVKRVDFKFKNKGKELEMKGFYLGVYMISNDTFIVYSLPIQLEKNTNILPYLADFDLEHVHSTMDRLVSEDNNNILPRDTILEMKIRAEANKVICAISLEEVSASNCIITTCFHVFNTDAFARWYAMKKTCPMCRINCEVL